MIALCAAAFCFALSVAVYGQQSRDLLKEPVQTWHPFGDRGTRWAVVVGIIL